MNAAARSPGRRRIGGQQLQGLQVHCPQRQPADLQVQGLQRQPLFSILSMGLLLFGTDVDSPCANRL
jgi:hypothetical protein